MPLANEKKEWPAIVLKSIFCNTVGDAKWFCLSAIGQQKCNIWFIKGQQRSGKGCNTMTWKSSSQVYQCTPAYCSLWPDLRSEPHVVSCFREVPVNNFVSFLWNVAINNEDWSQCSSKPQQHVQDPPSVVPYTTQFTDWALYSWAALQLTKGVIAHLANICDRFAVIANNSISHPTRILSSAQYPLDAFPFYKQDNTTPQHSAFLNHIYYQPRDQSLPHRRS